jgi:hypothetical protein
MKKQIPALIAAFLVTGLIASFMILTSLNAYFNPNGVPVSNDPATVSNVSQTTDYQQAQIAQLQSRIQEYQQREQKYEALLQQDQLHIQQDQIQFQQVQQLLFFLQQRGIIRIQSDGRVIVSGGD